MTQYVPAAGGETATTLPPKVGSTYNIGLSDGTRYYGYLFQNQGQQSKGLTEKTDIASRTALVNYGSPNLVDRDLVFYPRVSQGDFSGGGLQVVYIDPSRYWDSDLNISTAGYLKLRPQWARTNAGGTQTISNPQVVNYNGNPIFVLNNTTDQNYYYLAGGAVTAYAIPGFGAGTAIRFVETDGFYFYVMGTDGASAVVVKRAAGLSVSMTDVITSTVGTKIPIGIWTISNGTGGYFLYYALGNPDYKLYKVDLTATLPVLPASHVQVPMGGSAQIVVDLVSYNNGIAILTVDHTSNFASAADLFFFDGANTTRIVRIEGYTPTGMCACLGDLYLGLEPSGSFTTPLLARIASGSYQVVAYPNGPLPVSSVAVNSATVLQPRAGGSKVFWPVVFPAVNGISGSGGYLLVYDAVNEAVSHLPTRDGDDFQNFSVQALRSFATSAEAIAMVGNTSTQGWIQYQKANYNYAGSTLNYQTSGWLVSSHYDFSTPAIEKRFKTIQVHHAPLAAGQAIKVNAYVDLDPTNFTTSLTPTATTTNNTVGTVNTTLSLGANVGVGRTMYFAVQLTAGTSNVTTPVLTYVAVEVGGTWVWDLDLDCTAKAQTLGHGPDTQGINGKDKYFLLRNAYENGTYLTLYLSESVSYTVAVESLEGQSISYSDKTSEVGPVKADQEWAVHATLRQVA